MKSVLRFKEKLIPLRGLVLYGPSSPHLLQHLRCFSVTANQWQNERVPVKSNDLLNEFTTYCYTRDLPRAMKALNTLHTHKICADAVTCSELINCCLARGAMEQGKRVHQQVFSNGYESKTFLSQALFDQMSDRNVVSWTTMIAAYSNTTINNKALEFLILMMIDGVRRNMFTYSSVLRACDDLSNLRQLHTAAYSNSLIDVYSKMGQLECAMCTFNEMVTGDLVVRNSIIGGFAQNNDGDEALTLFKRMKRAGFSAVQSTLTSVLRACTSLELLMVEKDLISWSTMIIGHAQNGFSRKALELFKEMKVAGIIPNYITVLGLDEAVKLIHEMECEPDAVTWRALLAEYAAKQIIKLDRNDAGTHILLSNIYVRTQKWEDVLDLRRSMKERGVNKEPGCSWIEVNKKIHAFIVGDNSHPQIKEINKELNQIIWRLKEMGYVPDTNFVLQDLKDELMEDSLLYHSEKIAVAFGVMTLFRDKTIRIRTNLRICGDCHLFAKLLAQIECRSIVIRDPIRNHHFQDGVCSC
ncbi:unnamed protein product [Withania somnifera]